MYAIAHHETPSILDGITLTVPSVLHKGGVIVPGGPYRSWKKAAIKADQLNSENHKAGRYLVVNDDNPNEVMR